MKNKSGNQKGVFRVVILAVAVLALIAAGYSGYMVSRQAAQDQENRISVGKLRVETLGITQLARDATAGQEAAFERLGTSRDKMKREWSLLKKRLDQQGEVAGAKVSSVNGALDKVDGGVQALVDGRETVLFATTVANQLNAKLPQVQADSQEVVDVLVARSAPASQITMAQEQLWLLERIGRNIDKMIAGSADASKAADQFKTDSNRFQDTLDAMKNGNVILGISRVTNKEALDAIAQIEDSFAVVANDIDRIHASADALGVARQSADALVGDVPSLLSELDGLDTSISQLSSAGARPLSDMTTLISVGVFLGALVVIGLLNYRSAQRNLAISEKEQEENTQAIVRLLSEISDLATGDLTVQATVTEDFTGNIADSINFAIGELRTLVQNVAQTSKRVSASTDRTRATSERLAESAEHQAQEIAGASAAINEMAITIDQVSSNSSESAAVAEKSVSIAKNGAQIVRNTIQGMDTIREQIQDTSKRIKRLGESSQEIGDIVSLINDIAEQTNILALNAAIQAAMAGEAGRGFAVVADEVQRLAERSAVATKQIATLVKTIQTDTNDAVASMEQTTSEVVKGAELANNAGVALEEIETVSTHLAELIQDISEAAKHQATTSSHISNTMNVIQEITSQTLAGTNETTRSVGELAAMAIEMRESVSGFILPEEEEVAIEVQRPEIAAGKKERSVPVPEVAAASVVADLESEETAEADLEQITETVLSVEENMAATSKTAEEEFLDLEEFEAELEEMLGDQGKKA